MDFRQRRVPSPQILAVDDRHRHGVEIEIIQQPRIDADPRIIEIRLARRPIRRFRIGAAATIGTKMVLYGAALPLIGRHVLDPSGQAKLRRRVIPPQRATLRAERSSTTRHAGWRLAHFEPGVAAVAASFNRHALIPSIYWQSADVLLGLRNRPLLPA